MSEQEQTGGPWTSGRLIEWTRKFFESRGIDDARLEAELLLAHALGVERIQLYVRFQEEVAEPALSQFRELVRQRARHVPTQYLLGYAHFRHLKLKVTPAVLIPRPETELVVDEALALLKPRRKADWAFQRGQFVDLRGGQPEPYADQEPAPDQAAAAPSAEPSPESGDDSATPGDSAAIGADSAGQAAPQNEPPALPAEARVLDLCTGSGCIAIAIAAECPSVRVWATDISTEALAVAGENAAAADVNERLTLLAGDLWSALDSLPPEEQTFDLITCNPPYISQGELGELMPEVRDHEPRQALISGDSGQEIIEQILAGAPGHLRRDGHLLMEIGYQQGPAVRDLVQNTPGLELVELRKDLGGHPRVVHARRSSS